jgi:hypothetical protein
MIYVARRIRSGLSAQLSVAPESANSAASLFCSRPGELSRSAAIDAGTDANVR